MHKTFFSVPEILKKDCAPTLKQRHCLPHDPKAYALLPFETGHAGVFLLSMIFHDLLK